MRIQERLSKVIADHPIAQKVSVKMAIYMPHHGNSQLAEEIQFSD
jgi:hypothetical protein